MVIRLAALACFALAGSLAIASAASGQAPVRKTLEQVVSDLSSKGYVIREIEMDDGNFEATVVDRQNVVSEAKIDGVTGEIRRLERKH